ncbi:radical SAM protein [Alkalitalea saponilacus]|uniref:Putative pyruvate formate lyase activating enzyme n=1 Tax=Alkalitalea saponilacus TaxID=889453 RepID=A0A1T5GS71_9BACT|nr:radical SAM protein [Alkalitalea saponilacus]SKC11257.1 putative pyruvate formate lyase activating enzyme [Alkalitalea saponilacus]
MRCRSNLDRRNFVRLAGMGLGSLMLMPADIYGGVSSMKRNDARSGATINFTPTYIDLHRKGELRKRVAILNQMMRRCTLCPRECETERFRGRRGDCNANSNLEISSVTPHFGEERELVGQNGSGTIFFTNCSLLCVFCINYDISQKGRGRRQSVDFLANSMLRLQEMGCHNVNLVTPSHYVPHIVEAVDIAAGKGLRLPIVYNTCGWEKLEVLRLLDGIVDIYLADFKYFDSQASDRFSPGAVCYPETTQKAFLEMQRQTGVAKPDPATGLMHRGLMVRHLVMPNNAARTDKVLHWIGENLPKETYINLMSQYTPVFKANQFPEISRRITREEYTEAIAAAQKAGLTNVVLQGG